MYGNLLEFLIESGYQIEDLLNIQNRTYEVGSNNSHLNQRSTYESWGCNHENVSNFYATPLQTSPLSASNFNNFYDQKSTYSNGDNQFDVLESSPFKTNDFQINRQQPQPPQSSKCHRPISSRQIYNYNMNQQENSFQAVSNIYNTYTMPYKDSSSSSMPMVTNGQSLAMTIYDSLLDNVYKMSSSGPSSNYGFNFAQNAQPFDLVNSFNGQHSADNDNYNLQQQQQHYVQQSNANNQNQLDKIAYHSTPFRPCIVNLPAQLGAGSGCNDLSVQTYSAPTPP